MEPIVHEEISRAARLASTSIVQVMTLNQQRGVHMIDQATAMSSIRCYSWSHTNYLTHAHPNTSQILKSNWDFKAARAKK